MRIALFLISLTFGLFCGQYVVAQTIDIVQFNLRPDAASILVQWEVSTEENVTEYQLYRRVGDETGLSLVHTMEASGLSLYEYFDNDIFKDERRVVFYELHVIQNGQVFKFYTALSHNPTAIQRTWGSIKKMFQ